MDRKQIRALVASHKPIKLDLGCGRSKLPGFLGIDARKAPGVDVAWNLESFPWPLPDNCAEFVRMSHFWEHVKPWLTLSFMEEMHRVCRDGARVLIISPYGAEFRFVQDPTHCNPSNELTFLYWDSAHPLWSIYEPSVFHLESFRLVVAPGGHDFEAHLVCCKPPRAKSCSHTRHGPDGKRRDTTDGGHHPG